MKRFQGVLLSCLLAASMLAVGGCSNTPKPDDPDVPDDTQGADDGPSVEGPGLFMNEATVLIDGQPVFINFDYNLPDSTYNSRNPVNVTSTQDVDMSHNVVLYAETILYDVSIVAVSGGDPYYIEETIFTADQIHPSDYLLFTTLVPDGEPCEAITFTDSNGVQHCYILIFDGQGDVTCTNEVELFVK